MLNQRIQTGWWEPSTLPAPVYNIVEERHLTGYNFAKRCLDVFIASIALVVLSPLLALISVAIVLDSRGPVFHIQHRTGQGGKVFRFYKFRSMTNGQDHTKEHRQFAVAYINGQPVHSLQVGNGATVYKPASNSRKITRVGKWLRQTSLDELPQLINVLRGDMSLVGPRPTMDYETALYTDHHCQRLAVLPGLTGWAQVHGRSGLSFDEIVTLDVDYIAKRSLWLDLKILLATVPVVLAPSTPGVIRFLTIRTRIHDPLRVSSD